MRCRLYTPIIYYKWSNDKRTTKYQVETTNNEYSSRYGEMSATTIKFNKHKTSGTLSDLAISQ